MRPIAIPPTTPTRYLSFHAALNLRGPGELTGDWHPRAVLFALDKTLDAAVLAGEGQPVDTTPSLGALGVREMSAELRAQGVPARVPVWVANHPRAIADLVMLDLQAGREPMIAGARAINAWLDTEAQVDDLRERYLAPLRAQLTGEPRAILDAWLPTVRFDA